MSTDLVPKPSSKDDSRADKSGVAAENTTIPLNRVGPRSLEVQDHLVKISKIWEPNKFFLQIGSLFTYKNFQKFWGPKTNVSLDLAQGRP